MKKLINYKSNELDKYFKDMADYYMKQIRNNVCPCCNNKQPLVINTKETFSFECSCGFMYEQIKR